MVKVPDLFMFPLEWNNILYYILEQTRATRMPLQ
jgi:hypothetical protein